MKLELPNIEEDSDLSRSEVLELLNINYSKQNVEFEYINTWIVDDQYILLAIEIVNEIVGNETIYIHDIKRKQLLAILFKHKIKEHDFLQLVKHSFYAGSNNWEIWYRGYSCD